jgi:hypothetical protein
MDRKDEPPPEIVKNGIIGDPETLCEQGLGRPFLSIGLYGDFRRLAGTETSGPRRLGGACRRNRFGLRMRKIKPRDSLLIGGEIGMALRRGTDRRVEHRREKARDEGEDRRIRPAGLKKPCPPKGK